MKDKWNARLYLSWVYYIIIISSIISNEGLKTNLRPTRKGAATTTSATTTSTEVESFSNEVEEEILDQMGKYFGEETMKELDIDGEIIIKKTWKCKTIKSSQKDREISNLKNQARYL